MAYSEKALALRRCTAKNRFGDRCRRYAVWGDSDQRCDTHRKQKLPSKPVVCWCRAYTQKDGVTPFPHRPGSGICAWPDPPKKRLIRLDS